MHRIVPTLFLFMLLIIPSMLHASITGTVFKDADADGIADTAEVGLPGIVISAFDASGMMVSQTASCGTFAVSIPANPPSIPSAINIPSCALANIGQYTLNGLTVATQYRLETTLLDPLLFSSANGVDAVRFATDGDSNVRFGVNYPEDYCQNNPRIIAGCYVIDLTQPTLAAPYDPASVEPLIVSWPYNTRFTSATNAQVHTGSYTDDADYGDFGHVFGVAIHRPTLQAFFSGIASPQWDFGSGGIGAIYTADYSGAGDTFVPGSTSVFADLAPLTNLTNQTPVTMGVLDRFGEQGLGGIEISDDGATMWAINMGAGSLLEIDIGNPAVAPIAADVNEIAISGAGCVNGTFRPSALALHRGNVFIGGICDASSGTLANLTAVVLEYDGLTFTSRMSEVLDFNVNQIFPEPSFQMAPWSNANAPLAPQPVMTDLVFDDNEGIIIGIMPRVVYNFFAQTAGIMLRADPDGMGNFVLESAGSSGPYTTTAETNWAGSGFTPANPEPLNEGPGDDYFFENGIFSGAFQAPPFSPPGSATYHPVLFSAGITVVPGTGEVAAGYTDPLSINSFGVRYLDRTNGETVAGLQFGGLKVALVSDVSAICHSAPLEIGNRLWCDADPNGIQDPGEAGVNGIEVRLQCGLDNPVTVMTAGDGNYTFTDALYAAANGGDIIPRGASCSVSIATNGANGTAIDTACGGVQISPPNNGGADLGADLRDSDGMLMGVDVVIPVATGGSGNNTYALDQGFFGVPELDFGDAPDTYGTTIAAMGPNHVIVPGFSLGATVDDEMDGQPGPLANFDGADEDGVTIVGGMAVACSVNNALTVNLTNGASAATPQLDAWIDFNGDGDFDAAEHLFSGTSAALSVGVNNLTFDVPCDAVAQATSYARFRLSSAGSLTPLGAATNGEVEDYTVVVKGIDLGDAPNTYGTTIAAMGASHGVDAASPLFLGACVDTETDGQPNVGASGDDLGASVNTVGTCASANDDEDGVVFNDMLIACGMSNVTVTAGQAGVLDGWIDFNGDGDFDATDQVFTGQALAAGANALSINVPCDAVPQSMSYARFRFSSVGVAGPTGASMDGEVEDYTVVVKGIDLADAPNTYGTTIAAMGASHGVDAASSLFLGACVDTETDGQPNAGASGDDLGVSVNTVGTCASANDDEDGVVFNDMLIACGMSNVTVTAGQAGVLDGWIDFNGDGDFDATDQVFTGQALAAGANALSINVPCDAVPQSMSYARFRFSSVGVAGPTGASMDGEVEDYTVAVKGIDLGDAPNTYGTTLAATGAQHVIDPAVPLFLGACVDAEVDGQPSGLANGDDTGAGVGTLGACLSANDDEDGVMFQSMFVACDSAIMTVMASQFGLLNAWIDYNGDGDFDSAEQITTNTAVISGPNPININVPCDAVAQSSSYARFRVSAAGGDGPTGAAMTGEVEDYVITIKGMDLGDAPDTYSTTMAMGGAQHIVDPVNPLYLGACVDTEAEGQPMMAADGDDSGVGLAEVGSCAVANDDEDGVIFTDPLVVCDNGNITVTAAQAGRLDAWIDFNGDGDFGEAADQIFTNQALSAGANILNVNVPCGALPQASSYARFRFSSAGGLAAGGSAMDGEVEDYNVVINEPVLLDFGDAPDTYGTTSANSGANHIIVAGFSLGATIDDELDGQPNGAASGDDADEDGVDIVGGMPVACSTGNALTVTLTNTAGVATPRLDGWIDFNGDGDFDAAEHLFAGTSSALSTGVNNLTFDVPCDAAPQSSSYARFRLSSAGSLTPLGSAANGEVEDYLVQVKGIDLGDAPDTYGTTLASSGARHIVNAATPLFLGACVDTEADGQPVVAANGDDVGVGLGTVGICATVNDDEDGVSFDNMIIACGVANMTVTSSQAGLLNAWIDFNGDGDFDASDQIASNTALVAGANSISANVPCDAVPQSDSYARFRVSVAGNDGPTGLSQTGEIEDYRVVVKGLDLGDVPDSYGTLLASTGAQHVVDPAIPLFLGVCVDSEADGQPSVTADGDDLAVGITTIGTCTTANDDEDGVVFNDFLEVCGSSNVTVTAGLAGQLDAWIDFDGNGVFDATDQIANNMALVAGANALTVNVPCDAVAQSSSYARFRFSAIGGNGPTGQAMSGEVEDYAVAIGVLSDLGDAPDSYGTTVASGGAQHIVNPTIPLFFGACVDTEANGQPTVAADGDDLGAGLSTSGTCAVVNDDEDGVSFDNMIIACGTASMTVTSSQAGLLNAWIDFNGDGDFDASDQIASNTALVAGANSISANVPCDAVPQSDSYARFRVSVAGNDGPTGLSQTGEIEDYAVVINGLDLGDIPDTYGTLLTTGGAQHVINPTVPMFLGSCVDSEADGQPNTLANGDDLGVGLGVVGTCAAINDEDGVVFTDTLETCNSANVSVTAGQAGQLDAWIDFNGDGDFDATDQIANNLPLTGGVNTVTVDVPCDAVAQPRSYARFRFSATGGSGPTGLAMTGEVEDYSVPIAVLLDFGDAPDTYGTTVAANGPRHVVVPGFSLGASEDDELDGQPSVNADGDGADEDGIVFADAMPVACSTSNGLTVTLTNSAGEATPQLDGWIDFNGDGDFDITEHLFGGSSIALTTGVNNLTFDVPCDAVPQSLSYARFRLSSSGSLTPLGAATNGEIEDYTLTILGLDFGDLPDTFGTVIISGGAQHVINTTRPIYLGSCVDAEADGMPTINADGDDLAVGSNTLGTCVGNDDEDGVSFTTPIIEDSTNTGVIVDMPVGSGSQACFLNVWFDFDHSGVFADGIGEQVIIDQLLAADSGQNALLIVIPDNIMPGDTAVRFRCDSTGGLDPDGLADDGEVEDYVVTVGQNANLALIKEVDSPTVEQGELFNYTLTVTNNGPGDAVNVTVTDQLPVELVFVSTTGCAEDPVAMPLCSLGDLANGESVSYTITAQLSPMALGDIVNTAVADSDTSDPDESDNTEGATIGVVILIPSLSLWGIISLMALLLLVVRTRKPFIK